MKGTYILSEVYHFGKNGNLIRFGASEAADRRARQLNKKCPDQNKEMRDV